MCVFRRKSSQVLYRSDQGKCFLKINQNYFAHICPEYGFRVNTILGGGGGSGFAFTVGANVVTRIVKPDINNKNCLDENLKMQESFCDG